MEIAVIFHNLYQKKNLAKSVQIIVICYENFFCCEYDTNFDYLVLIIELQKNYYNKNYLYF